MGWWGDMRDKLEWAKDIIDQAPKYSLSWLRGVDEWNDLLNELGVDSYKEFVNIGLPTNCEIPEDWADPKYVADALPYIDIPEFDPDQPLRKLN